MSGFITAPGKDISESSPSASSTQKHGVESTQQPGKGVKKEPGPLTSAERQFLQIAAELDMEGIELATLAVKQGNSVATDNLSESFREDHARSLAALRELARSKRVKLTERSITDPPGSMFELARAFGRGFDQDYRSAVLKLQEQTIRVYSAAAKIARDHDIRAFAERNLGALKEQRDAMGAPRVNIEGEMVFRLIKLDETEALRASPYHNVIPTAPAPYVPGVSPSPIPEEPILALTSRYEGAWIGSVTPWGEGATLMMAGAAQAPRLQLLILPAIGSGEGLAEMEVEEEASQPERQSPASSRTSKGSRRKSKATPIASAPAPVIITPKPRTFFLFGRRTPAAQVEKTKGALVVDRKAPATRASGSRGFRLFGR